jgi:hypothetical protein
MSGQKWVICIGLVISTLGFGLCSYIYSVPLAFLAHCYSRPSQSASRTVAEYPPNCVPSHLRPWAGHVVSCTLSGLHQGSGTS